MEISVLLHVKQVALAAYECEMRDVPRSRISFHAEVLARHRGYCVGLNAAEAFALAKRIF